ncbi:MAG: hypothetical protein V4675_06675 [Verrucomicrobiota bacterium]
MIRKTRRREIKTLTGFAAAGGGAPAGATPRLQPPSAWRTAADGHEEKTDSRTPCGT